MKAIDKLDAVRLRKPRANVPALPVHLGLQFHLVTHLIEKLQARGKQVELGQY